MNRWFGFLLPLCLLLSGCAAPEEEAPAEPSPAPVYSAPPGELRLLYDDEPGSLDYLVTDSETALNIIANTVDTLLVFDSTGRLRPCLAESWEYDAPARTWTLTLRTDAMWFDEAGNEAAPVTAEDFVAAVRYILTPETDSPYASALFGVIRNAREYYDGLSGEEDAEPVDFSEVGVSAADERTLRYTLEKDVPDFPARLTDLPYLPVRAEQLERGNFGKPENLPLSCGACILAAREPQAETVLRRNPRAAYAEEITVDTVRFVYDPDAAVNAPAAAAEGQAGYAALSDENAARWLGDAALSRYVCCERRRTDRSVFLCFNFGARVPESGSPDEGAAGQGVEEKYDPENWEKAVNCEAFRQSIRRALDRSELYDEAFLGNTIVPAGFTADYAGRADRGDPFDPASAAEYRDAARTELSGLGAVFPVRALLPCPGDDPDALRRCERIEKMLESALGGDYIDVVVRTVSSDDFVTEVRRGGQYMLLECSWEADSFDAGTWAKPFFQPKDPDGSYGRGYRYARLARAVTDGTASAETVSEYFELVEKARALTDPSEREDAFARAEAYLIEHALAVPLGTGEPGYAVSRVDLSGCPAAGLGRRSVRGARLAGRTMTREETAPAPVPVPEEEPAPPEPAAAGPETETITSIYKK